MYRGHDVVAVQSYQILLRPQDEINLRRRSGSSKDVTNAQASRVRRSTNIWRFDSDSSRASNNDVNGLGSFLHSKVKLVTTSR
jgi:hypothetical protein